MKIALFAGQVMLGNGQLSAKAFLYWQKVVGLLQFAGHEVHQFGRAGEPEFGCDQFITATPLEVEKLLEGYDCWVSVDTYVQHLAAFTKSKVRGVVVWSLSDPKIFGYPHNTNLAKPAFFRKEQHMVWLGVQHNKEAFPDWREIVDAIVKEPANG